MWQQLKHDEDERRDRVLKTYWLVAAILVYAVWAMVSVLCCLA